jgi:hypothetical protein
MKRIILKITEDEYKARQFEIDERLGGLNNRLLKLEKEPKEHEHIFTSSGFAPETDEKYAVSYLFCSCGEKKKVVFE